MRPTLALPPRPAALLLALTGALLLFRLGAVPLLGPDEPRYARVAVEMARSGDGVTPTLQGRPWLEKPALYYWMAAGAFRALGETEAAARMPAVLATLLLVGATALVGARLFGGPAGLHAGFVTATGLLVFAYGRAASMDMLLAGTTTAAIGLVALRVLGIAGRFALPAAGALMGLATLAKGPVGIVLPVLVVVTAGLFARDAALLRRAFSWWAVALLALTAGPWYLLVWRAQGWAFVETFLVNHNLERFTTTIHRHPGALWYYLPVLFAGMFPWSGLLVPALASVRPRREAADAFVLAWAVAPLAFFSVAGSKLPGYILPCVPPLALLCGRVADRWARGTHAPGGGGRAAALALLALSAIVAASPLLAAQAGEPGSRLLMPAAAWSLVVAFVFSRRIGADPAAALRLLRLGAAGLLLLLALALPPILARRESGRALFLPARGREVLVSGAWRTAWMAGYFYNDGRVREVGSPAEIAAAATAGPVLALTGPAERRTLEQVPGVATVVLAAGPRGTSLVRVSRR